jgi:uncharacterized iron-regulated membrane protein
MLKTVWQRWMQNPQRAWSRRALFQVHLWTGIGVGLYVFVISVTGAVVVFRNDIYRNFAAKPVTVTIGEHRLTDDEIKAAVKRAYPDYNLSTIFEVRSQDQALEIWLESNDGRKKQHLFDPYTGADLGDSVPAMIRMASWFNDFHVNLLAGETGRYVNGVAASFFVVLSITGIVIWWPGIKTWRRSLIIGWQTNWKRLNWDLHSAMGLWTMLFVFMWGLTGVFLSLPSWWFAIVDHYDPPDPNSFEAPRRLGDDIFRLFARLHFGTFGGWPVRVTWFIIGLAPAVLFVTGVLMWWNRVLKPAFDRRTEKQVAPSLASVTTDGD